jgi:hypothetical protein
MSLNLIVPRPTPIESFNAKTFDLIDKIHVLLDTNTRVSVKNDESSALEYATGFINSGCRTNYSNQDFDVYQSVLTIYNRLVS